MKSKISLLLKKQGYHKIPLKNNGSGHFKIEAKINCRAGIFILDTGASHTVIDEAAAEKFGMKYSKAVSKDAGGLGNSSLKTQKSTGNMIELKGFKVKKTGLITIDLSHVNNALRKGGSGKIDGVIGSDILKKHKALIDYSERSLYLI